MGRRGPKPKAELSLAPTTPPSLDRAPPPGLAGKEIALATWNNAVDQLVKQGIYQSVDRQALERYAVMSQLCRQYEKACMEDGGVQTTSTGYRQLSGEMSCLLKTSGEMRSLERALGLNPEARRSMSLGAVEEQDELSVFLEEAS